MLSKLKGKKLPSIFTVICALVIEIIVFTLASPYFLTVKNVLNIGLYAATLTCPSARRSRRSAWLPPSARRS